MDSSICPDDISGLRAFNRLYTRRLGLLNAHLDRSPFTLAEARILYELAHRAQPTAAAIARALGLDRAQLSRTLGRFERRGLVRTQADPDHGRHRLLSLTDRGQAAFDALDRGTDEAIGGFLETLSPPRRGRLLGAARDIRQALGDLPVAEPVLRNPGSGDLGWIAHRQAILYAQEYGWNWDYEGLVMRILGDFVRDFDAACEAAWIAEHDGRVAGSIFLMRGDVPGVARLRLLYVEPEARGAGIGARLIAACIGQAREMGYARLDLWTNSVLTAARRLYERAGFRLVEEAPHRSFGHDLVGQTWSLDLKAQAAPNDGGTRSAPGDQA